LHETCVRYKEMLEPLMDEKELAESIAAVDDFSARTGPDLDAELRRRNSASPGTSFVKPFWDRMYLGGRYPVPINSNPFIAFEPDKDPAKMNQGARAASLVFHMCKFLQGVRDGTVSADMVGPDTPGCMDEYSRLFSTTRIPRRGTDELRSFPESSHIVIFRDTQIYSLEVMDSAGRLVPEHALRAVIEALLLLDPKATAPASGLAPSDLAILTTMERDDWADVREGLEASAPCNRQSLHTIDAAVFCLSLDRHTPYTPTNLAEQFMHGGVGGSWEGTTKDVREYSGREARWFDKSLVLMVVPSGDASIIFEHSPFDGSCVCRMADDVWHDSQGLPSGRSLPSHARCVGTEHATPVLMRLEWDLHDDAGGVTQGVRMATEAWQALQSITQTKLYTFDDFGTSMIKTWGM
jgi:hypothetical protein